MNGVGRWPRLLLRLCEDEKESIVRDGVSVELLSMLTFLSGGVKRLLAEGGEPGMLTERERFLLDMVGDVEFVLPPPSLAAVA